MKEELYRKLCDQFHWIPVSERLPDLGEIIEYYDPEPLEGMDRGITTYRGIMPSGATHWRISPVRTWIQICEIGNGKRKNRAWPGLTEKENKS